MTHCRVCLFKSHEIYPAHTTKGAFYAPGFKPLQTPHMGLEHQLDSADTTASSLHSECSALNELQGGLLTSKELRIISLSISTQLADEL